MNPIPGAISHADLLAMGRFSRKIDQVMAESCYEHDGYTSPIFCKADEWGHGDLPGYLPWMGPRHRFSRSSIPLSVFRGEGLALFLLARLLRPRVIAECYTGTGYATAWLAAGWSDARVYSVDNYSEGGIGGEGHQRVQEMMERLGLGNATFLHGTLEHLQQELDGRAVDLFFSDGPYGDGPALALDAAVVRHDDMCGQVPARSFAVLGGSHLSVMCPTVKNRDVLMAQMGRAFPVEAL